jgi:hypothetical protein
MKFSERYKLFYKNGTGYLCNSVYTIKNYQENARIYLDEYEVEEVDLRVNFDTSLLMKRFLVKE